MHPMMSARVTCAMVGLALIPMVSAPAAVDASSAAAATRAASYAPKGRPPLVDANQNASNPAVVDGGGQCYFGACYYYNTVFETGTVTGASVFLSQAHPKVGTGDLHSLTELAVQSSDQKQTVEVGWTVEGSGPPRLFVFHWVNGVPTCYNGCGFVPVSKKYHAGDVVNTGEQRTYSIQFKNGRWLVGYRGETLGYFPGSLWKGKFTKIGVAQAFGEVASSSKTSPHSEMGNGVSGAAAKSAAIRKFKLIGGASDGPAGYVDDEAPSVYQIAPYDSVCITSCGMAFGGPGFPETG